jgi:NodT family efflux transporter outer membrane factor (OMF) lipoprotein
MNKRSARRAPFAASTLAIALCLTGCASIDTAMLEAQVEALSEDIPTSWQTASDGATRPQNWQSLFDDRLLNGYLSKAAQNNLDLEQAAARVRQAEASIRLSKSVLGPSVNADLSASGAAPLSDLGNADDAFGSSLSARWDPDLFGANRAGLRQAEALFNLQDANTERLRRVVMAQTARAYIQTVEADQQLMLAVENLSFIEETKRVSEARFQAGDIARGDLALAELEYENAAAAVETQALATRSARRALSILIGDFGDDDIAVADALPQPAELGSTPLPAAVLGARFDILASRASLSAQIAALDATAKDDWPSLSLSGRIGSSGIDLGDLFDPDAYIASLGASLVGNLFDSGRNTAQIDAASARVDEALARYKQALRDAVSDVNNAFDRVQTLTTSLASLERARQSAEEALELEQIKFDLGETILLDVLTVQRRVNAIRGSRISTERRLLEAQIDAYLATGAP